MHKLDRMVQEVRRRSIYLMDRSELHDALLQYVVDNVPSLAASAITGANGAMPDHRGITCCYPAGFLNIYFNKEHEQHAFYREQYKVGRRTGMCTNFARDFRRDYPEDYHERYEPFGLSCGAQTVFFDQAGNLMGVYSWLKGSGFSYSKAEQTAMQAMAPSVFLAYRRYRWLLEEDFFGIKSPEQLCTGIIATDMKGRITYINQAASLRFSLGAGQALPTGIWGLTKQLLKTAQSGPRLGFREIFTHLTGVGNAICFRVSEEFGGRHLPVKEEGWCFFFPIRHFIAAGKLHLSKREGQVLRLMAAGKTDKEIAEELAVSTKTVQTYTQRLFEKFGTSNRTETTGRAMKFGLL